MFTRFMGYTVTGSGHQKKKIFIANVDTNRSDTNTLLVLDANTLNKLNSWSPPVIVGARYGDVALSDVSGGDGGTLLGAVGVLNSQEAYKKDASKDEILKYFAPFMTQIIIRQPIMRKNIGGEQLWMMNILQAATSEFVSVSSSSSNSAHFQSTKSGGWWIWHNNIPVFATLSKHREFSIFQLAFLPANASNQTHAQESWPGHTGAHVWRIDREPVSKEWAEKHCITDLNILREKVFESKACQAAALPDSYFLANRCPKDCRDILVKYKMNDRKCLKFLHDVVDSFEFPDNVFVRSLSQYMRLCNLGGKPEISTTKLDVFFFEHAYGCRSRTQIKYASQGTYPSKDVKGSLECGDRKRTIVVLSTEESVVSLAYAPPTGEKDGGGKIKRIPCIFGDFRTENECYPSSNPKLPPDKVCNSPCYIALGMSEQDSDDSTSELLSLSNRVRHISVEAHPPVEGGRGPSQGTICQSCYNATATDDLGCVYWPQKVFQASPGEKISSVTMFSSRTTEVSKKMPKQQHTQQVWAVAAVLSVNGNKGHNIPPGSSRFLAFEAYRFGNMTAEDESQVRPCNPVGSLIRGGPHGIPKHSQPVSLASNSISDSATHGQLFDSQVTQLDYAWMPLINNLAVLANSLNCSYLDRACLLRGIFKKATGHSASPDINQLISQASQMNSMPEGQVHVIFASIKSRSLLVLYFHEVPTHCHASSMSAVATIPGQRLVPSSYHSSTHSTSLGGELELLARIVNQVPLAGSAQHIESSLNGQFVFITMTRLQSEVNSMTRIALLCELLEKNPGDPALEAYREACSAKGDMRPRKPNILDFVQVATMCLPGTRCSTFSDKAIIEKTTPGRFSQYGFDEIPCKRGQFCAQGVTSDCPIGFICPFVGMSAPLPCKIDTSYKTSCFETKQIAPQDCPDGSMCYTPYMPGIPAPPGYKTTAKKISPRALLECAAGEYCSLGRSDSEGPDSLLCPAGTFCKTPSVPEPVNCTQPDADCFAKKCPSDFSCIDKCRGMFSCPSGTTEESICPPGRQCPTTQSPGNICPLTSYCGKGTFTQPPPCPEKFFCPTPSEKLPCPENHFCPGGMIRPMKCGILDICPRGSSKKITGGWGLILVFVLPLLICICIRYGYKKRDMEREKREHKKSLRRLSVLSRKNYRSGQNSELELASTDGTTTDSLLGERGISPSDFEYMMQIDNEEDEDELAIQDVFAPRKFRVDFEFKNLGLKLKSSGRSVLDGVTGKIKSAHITAVMGPSGAGKSTFVTTLAGKSYYGDTVGQILINGEERPLSDFKRVVGFVPQEDIMMRDLTVKENIWFSAQTRLPSDWSVKRKKRYRDATIEVLGLQEIRHSPIGDENTRGISGGQRKRVNIALEMVADPLVLFLDEPTSGLDSTSSMEVCTALRKIADIGLTVVTVLHQPRYEIFTQFHDVLLLGKGGRAVYLGPSKHALPYFEHNNFICPDKVNPPDFMMDVIGGNGGDERFKKMHPNFDPVELFGLWIDHQRKQRDAEEQGSASSFDQYLEKLDRKNTTVLSTSLESKQGLAFSGKALESSSLPEHDASLEPLVTGRQQAAGSQLVWRFLKRALKQITRHWADVCIDNGLLFLAAGFMSYINIMVSWVDMPPALPSECYENFDFQNLTICGQFANGGRLAMFGAGNSILTRCQMTVMAVALCTCASSIKVFGRERIVYWREAAGLAQPVHSIAYFVGKDLSVLPQQVLGPLLYGVIFTAMSANLGNFWNLYLILFGVTFVSYSIGYIVSISVPDSLSQLVGVVIVFCMSAFDGALPTIPTLQKSLFPLNLGFQHLSFLTPALRALYVNEAVNWIDIAKSSDIDMIEFSRETFAYGTYSEEFVPAAATLFAWGFGFRLVGVFIMSVKDSNKKL